MALFDNRVHDAGPPRKRHVGQPMPRFEDLRLVRGAGRYTDDISVAGQAFAIFVRAPHAHAEIVRIDVEAARAAAASILVICAWACGARTNAAYSWFGTDMSSV